MIDDCTPTSGAAGDLLDVPQHCQAPPGPAFELCFSHADLLESGDPTVNKPLSVVDLHLERQFGKYVIDIRDGGCLRVWRSALLGTSADR
jgi:hypothetical protein